MRKRCIYIAISLLLPNIVFSQGWNICVTGGIGFPVGKFNSTSTSNGSGLDRFANEGPASQLFATKKIKKTVFDVLLIFGYNNNNFNLNDYLNDQPGNSPGSTSIGGQAISNGDFQEFSFLGGLSIAIPKNINTWSINLRFLFGPTYSCYPFSEFAAAYYSYTQRNYIYINGSESLLFTLGIGLNIKCQVSKKIFITAGTDYFSTGARWRTTEQITNNNGISISQPYSDSSPINLINLMAGIGYQFGN